MKTKKGFGITKAMDEFSDQQTASLQAENKRLREVLGELVELKDMADLIENGFAAVHQSVYDKFNEEYETRKPLAWDEARKLIKK